MSNTPNRQPTIDIYPWPSGLGFTGDEDWWTYVCCQTEEDKLDLLVTLAHLSESVCQALLKHDPVLFDRFQLSPQSINHLCSVDADSLPLFVIVLVAQNNVALKGSDEL